MNIFWFRRDLRIDDNKGFFEALNAEKEVLSIFIFDKSILDELPKDDARVTFIADLLSKMNEQLTKQGKSLAIFYGKPSEIFEKLIRENKIENVYTNHDYEPYARKRDLEIYQIFKKNGIGFNTYKDQVIFEKSEVVKDDNTPYVVYTPYSKKWKQNFKKEYVNSFNSEDLMQNISDHSHPFLTLKDIGFETSKIKIAPFDVSSDLIANYEETRNFPALSKTSLLGPQ